METINNVELYDDNSEPDIRQVVVNTELGAFGDNNVLSFIQTQWDINVDGLSANPGKQM